VVLARGDGLGVLSTADGKDGREEGGSEGCKKEGAGETHERGKRATYVVEAADAILLLYAQGGVSISTRRRNR